jgi:hypothetical protein
MTTRRAAGVGAIGAGVGVSAAAEISALVLSTGDSTAAGASTGATGATGRTNGAATTGAVPGRRSPGFCGCVGAEATGAGATTTIGGRAITGPSGGRLAIAGGGAGATICAPCRGRGTMRRGAGAATGVAATAALTLELAATLEPGVLTGLEEAGASVLAGGGTTTAAARAGGALRAAASACLRSKIAFSASPGLDTCDKLNAGFASTRCFAAEVPLRSPPLK